MAKKEKCIICDEEIGLTFLDKPMGTVVRIKNGDKNEAYFVCSACQRSRKDIKKEVEKLFK
jgi:hypothetical protein